MLIICSGPDTFRARERARELALAFKQKFDPEGKAMETIDVGDGISDVLNLIGAASLFSTKKFLRADGLLKAAKPAELKKLAARIEQDKDQTIVVTVETDPPSKTTLTPFDGTPLFHYPFPIQDGTAFRAWVRERAKRFGVVGPIVDSIAQNSEGDSWFAIQELQKNAAHPQEAVFSKSNESIFQIADATLQETKNWRLRVHEFRDENILSILLFQLRTFFRVNDGAAHDVKPFLQNKLRQMKIANPGEKFKRFARAFLGSRSGISIGEEEVETLL